MFKNKIAVAVMCVMASGYRRAGIALTKGENQLDVTEEQLLQFNDDPNVSVMVTDSTELDNTITHEDTAADLAGVGERTFGFDCCSAPEELHHWIAVIDDLNSETPLTKKPNCDHLTITVDDEPLTPTAAQRDAAWEWYQNNVVIGSVASTTSEETGE